MFVKLDYITMSNMRKKLIIGIDIFEICLGVACPFLMVLAFNDGWLMFGLPILGLSLIVTGIINLVKHLKPLPVDEDPDM